MSKKEEMEGTVTATCATRRGPLERKQAGVLATNGSMTNGSMAPLEMLVWQAWRRKGRRRRFRWFLHLR